MKRSRAWLFRILIALGLYAFAECAAFAALRILERTGRLAYAPVPLHLYDFQHASVLRLISPQTYYAYDAGLGWTLRPGTHHDRYRANAAGLRGSREYAETAPPGVLRVAAFGDSFTHGDGEADPETWPASVERLDPAIEVLNYGVSGYGVDQAFLRYRAEGERFHPRVVVIAFMTDDIGRQLSVYRLFMNSASRFPFAKPRFVLEGDGLRLLPNPMQRVADYAALATDEEATLRRLGEHDFFFNHGYFRGPFDFLPSVRLFKAERGHWRATDLYDPDGEALAVSTRVLLDFVRLIEARGARPLVALLPGAPEVVRFQKDGSRRYAALVAFLDARKLPYLDLVEPLARAAGGDPKPLFNVTTHYSAAGNGVVAAALLPRLRATSLP